MGIVTIPVSLLKMICCFTYVVKLLHTINNGIVLMIRTGYFGMIHLPLLPTIGDVGINVACISYIDTKLIQYQRQSCTPAIRVAGCLAVRMNESNYQVGIFASALVPLRTSYVVSVHRTSMGRNRAGQNPEK